jgi:hypothetical protein
LEENQLQLFQEIIENEKARLELFKWKIILVAGLGAAASGLIGVKPIHPALSAALIPFVCVYVDLLAQDLTLRIAVIARYFVLVYKGGQQPSESQYVAFVGAADQIGKMPTRREALRTVYNQLRDRKWVSSAYGVGFLAQGLSTFVLSAGVVCWGFLFLPNAHAWFLVAAAGFGIIALCWSYLEYKRRFTAVAMMSSLPEVIANH